MVGTFYREREHGGLLLRSTWNAVKVDELVLLQCPQNVFQDRFLLCGKFLIGPDFIDKGYGGDQRRGGIQVLRAGLEFLGERGIRSLGETHCADHFSSAHIRGHSIKPFLLSVKDAGSGSSIKLMPGKGVKVAVQILDVNFLVNHALGAVNKYRNAVIMAYFHYLLDRIYKT